MSRTTHLRLVHSKSRSSSASAKPSFGSPVTSTVPLLISALSQKLNALYALSPDDVLALDLVVNDLLSHERAARRRQRSRG